MNKFSNDKKIIVGIVAIIFIAIVFLFVDAEITSQKASQGYDIIAFQNVEQNVSSSRNINEVLSFYIQNLEKKDGNYKIAFLVNNELISETTESIESQEQKTIEPTQDVVDKIKNSDLGVLKYEIEIEKGSEIKNIYKQIKK